MYCVKDFSIFWGGQKSWWKIVSFVNCFLFSWGRGRHIGKFSYIRSCFVCEYNLGWIFRIIILIPQNFVFTPIDDTESIKVVNFFEEIISWNKHGNSLTDFEYESCYLDRVQFSEVTWICKDNFIGMTKRNLITMIRKHERSTLPISFSGLSKDLDNAKHHLHVLYTKLKQTSTDPWKKPVIQCLESYPLMQIQESLRNLGTLFSIHY